MSDFRNLTDLAARRFGSGVIAANDEFFAEKESLLNEGRADFHGHTLDTRVRSMTVGRRDVVASLVMILPLFVLVPRASYVA